MTVRKQIWLLIQLRQSQRGDGGSGQGHQENVIFTIFSLLLVALIYLFAEIQTAEGLLNTTSSSEGTERGGEGG